MHGQPVIKGTINVENPGTKTKSMASMEPRTAKSQYMDIYCTSVGEEMCKVRVDVHLRPHVK
jgi:hypothetical protein